MSHGHIGRSKEYATAESAIQREVGNDGRMTNSQDLLLHVLDIFVPGGNTIGGGRIV